MITIDAVSDHDVDPVTAGELLDDQPASIDLLNYQQQAFALSRVFGIEGRRTPFPIGMPGTGDTHCDSSEQN
jgi:hypothetical protein